jgi:YhcH/YjgK/YiaL family protein
MLIGSTNQTRLMKTYPSVIQNVLQYLNSIDTSVLEVGRHEMPGFDPQQLWFVVLEYEKESLSHFYPEVHKHFSDLQIVLEGTETMAWSIDTGLHLNAEEYNNQRDLQYYQFDGIELNYIAALPGCFYLFTPNIVHITNIEDGNSSPVRKLVVKIHNDLLGVE